MKRKMLDVAVRDAESLTAEDLWKDFISTRTPVLIKGHIKDESWKVPKLWNEKSYLKQKAGDVVVKVEKRGDMKASFGKGRKMAMEFGALLDRIAAGDETLYLSPQEASVGMDGLPEVVSPPLDEFRQDFPLRPQLMGNLIPHQINVWMGNAKHGSSSGLHHDFHDNLYILVKGKKRFKLYPPESARRMYTVGTIAQVHANGRIVYETDKPTLSDGSLVEALEEFQKMKAAKDALKMAEQEQDEEAIQRAEEELDALMEKTLDAAFDEVGSGSEETSSQDGEESPQDEIQVDEKEPSNFCKVDLSLPSKTLEAGFPEFPKHSTRFGVEVEEGNMLYLPTGWFHEVTSFNMDDASNGHIAFNYWFHPPDNLKAAPGLGFEKPYQSDYWPMMWADRMLDAGEVYETDVESELDGSKISGKLKRGREEHTEQDTEQGKGWKATVKQRKQGN